MRKAETPQMVLIAGPTASGKSAVALALAERINGCIINADSMQVYDTLRVLTARPDANDLARVPHRLYGHVRVGAPYGVGSYSAGPYSVSKWQKQAIAEIRACQTEGRVPIITGGTGLYFKSLTDGLVEIPDIPGTVRQALVARLADEGAAALHGELAVCDPDLAARLPPSDRQRILRGLEVFTATGTPLSQWQARQPGALTAAPDLPPALKLLVIPDRQWLYARCDRRFMQMLEAGALAEVAALLALELSPNHPLMKAIGVAELAAYLAGTVDLETAQAQAQQQTRRYAKRQMTWFRNQIIAWNLFNEKDYESNFHNIFSFISRNYLTVG